MKNTRLIRLLKCLSSDEFLNLKKACQSPVFSVSRQHLVFYDTLRPHFPDFDSEELSQENVFAVLYPDTPFDSRKLRTFLSRFNKVIEEYLVLVKMRKDEFNRKKMLVDIFGKDGEHELFKKSTYRLLDELEDGSDRDLDYFWEKLKLSWDMFYHPGTQKLLEKKVDLKSINTSLDLFFTLAKIQIACDLKTKEMIMDEESNISFLEEIEEQMKILYSEESPGLRIFLQILKMKRNEREEDFLLAKDELLNHSELFSEKEKQFVLFHLLNFVIRRNLSGISAQNHISLELLKYGLKNNLLIRNGKMTNSTFSNIVAASSQSGEFEWAEAFIEEYESYLDSSARSDAKTFSLAYLAFFKKDFSRAIDLVNNYKFSRSTDICRGDFLLLRSYFEFSILDPSYFRKFTDFSNAWEKKLKRDSILSEEKKESYLNSISVIRKMGKDYNKKKVNREKLLKVLNEKELIVGRPWIKNRIKEL